MTKRFAVLTLILLGASAAFANAPLYRSKAAIPNRYIVVFKDGAVRSTDSILDGASVRDVANDLALVHGALVRRSFQHALRGAVLEMSAEQAEALANDPRVEYLEEDGVVRIAGAGSELNPPSWGLDRIDQASLPLNSTYGWTNDGTGVQVYVVDSGILSTHVDFGGRVNTTQAYTTIQDGYGTEDCLGHGTHVAGVVGGLTYGVAKNVTLHPVRVLDCTGMGSTSDMIAAVDWITSLYPTTTTTVGKGGKTTTKTNPPPPVVVNMSLETPPCLSLDNAIQTSINAGITYVVAAGNDGGDACQYTPAQVGTAITVGATDSTDTVATFSNQGTCVKIFAPGVNITSAFIRSTTDSLAMTGTSAASPHVAGLAAQYIAANPGVTPAEVETALVATASTGLAGVASGSPNALATTAAIGVDLPPVAAFTFSCAKNRSCSFNASTSTDVEGIVSYAWTFGDGATGSGVTPSHRYSAAGTYSVTLAVTDTAGQATTVRQSLSLN